jgi:hypothetical protein
MRKYCFRAVSLLLAAAAAAAFADNNEADADAAGPLDGDAEQITVPFIVIDDSEEDAAPHDGGNSIITEMPESNIPLIASAAPDTRRDTVSDNFASIIEGTFVGIGAGLSAGSIPLFAMWQNSLPDGMSGLGIDPLFGIDPTAGDTAALRYSPVESPDMFNFTLPLSVSVHHVNSKRAVAFALSFFRSAKQFQSAITVAGDTSGRRINIYEMLGYTSLMVEAAYKRPIPPVFFSIDGSRQTFLSLSAGISPLNYFTRESEVEVANRRAPDDDTRMQLAAKNAKERFAGLSSNGTSVQWRAGFSTIRGYSHGGGLEMGIYYGGSYNARFYHNGNNVTNGQIHAGAENADKPLSFVTHRIEFQATFLKPVKRGARDAEQEPIDDNLTDEASADDVSNDDVSDDKAQADKKSVDEISANETSADEESTDNEPADEISAGDNSESEKSADKNSDDKESTDTESNNENSTDKESPQ